MEIATILRKIDEHLTEVERLHQLLKKKAQQPTSRDPKKGLTREQVAALIKGE